MLAAVVLLAAYAWPHDAKASSLEQRIPPPSGFTRDRVAERSFSAFLRQLPLKPGTPPVHLFNGQLKDNQSAHAAVFDIDVGATDLQQCADSVIRLRAEYLYQAERFAELQFHATSGDMLSFDRWRRGERPSLAHRHVVWKNSAPAGHDYATFRAFLDVVFQYAGTHSLATEMLPVADGASLAPGEVFITGGFPGHVVIVLDRATNQKTGEVAVLLGQGYMPAQDFQLLRNPNDAALSPWYDASEMVPLRTPEWKFAAGSRRCFDQRDSAPKVVD